MHSSKLYKVIFKGELVSDRNTAEERNKIANLLKIKSNDQNYFFSGKEIELKGNLEFSEAQTLVKKLKNIGMLVYTVSDNIELNIIIEPQRKKRKVLFFSIYISTTLIVTVILIAFFASMNNIKENAAYELYLQQQE